MKKTVGFYGGKFYPVSHSGHIYSMIQASTIVDELHVFITYDEDYEINVLSKDSKVPHVDYMKRLRWMRQIAKDLPHVTVHAIYEENVGTFEAWEDGANNIKKVIGKPIDYVFSSESSYSDYFSKLYPEAQHVIIDEPRGTYNISGTKIREEGVFKNWDLIPEIIRRDFVKKVMVVGTESTGKSTLVKNLATLYNTNHVEEHGRTYYDELGDYEIYFEEDYPKIAYRQKYFEEQSLKNANKVVFMDTEAIVTERFLIQGHGKESELLFQIAEEQKYDLWLFLEPDVEFVQDGGRQYGHVREESNNLLKRMLKLHNVSYISVSGDYNKRLKTAIEHVDKLIDNNKK